MIILANALVLPASLVTAFDLALHPLTDPAQVNRSGIGEPCEHCQLEGRHVEVSAYGETEGGEYLLVEACMACVGHALYRAEASTTHPVTLEYAA